MKRLLFWILLLVSSSATAVEVAGVQVPEHVTAGGVGLRLNGAGIRTRLIFKVYVGALYLKEKKSSPAEVIAEEGPKRVSMVMLRDLTSEQLIDALELGIRNNHSETQLATLRARLDELAGIMKSIDGAKENMVVTLDFIPGTGTVVTVGGSARGKPITGRDFYDALLRIWLGEKPVDSDLKQAMLGGG